MSSEVSTRQKLIVLSLLVIQNASSSLLMRYSRGVLNESYNPLTAVILSEFCKLSVCILLIMCKIGESGLNDDTQLSKKYVTISSKLYYLISNSGYTWVPATCYFIQNSLYYTASGNLSSSVFATLQQFKILSAALCSVFFLRKYLAMRQWRALILLIFGGILMEYHTFELHEDNKLQNNNDPIKGTTAMLTIVTISGFAGVITELLLKNKSISNNDNNESKPKLSIWDRNIQLAFWSIIFGFISYFINALFINTETNNDPFFNGWSHITLILVILWTCGGLLVALTIKYTDVIIKGFASAISLVFVCIGGNILLSDTLDIIFLIGAGITIISTFNYNDKDRSTQSMIIQNNDNNTKK